MNFVRTASTKVKAGVAGFLGTAIWGGVLIHERSELVHDTITQADRERAEASTKCVQLEEEIKQLEAIERTQQAELEDKCGTVKTLWDERDRRIASETQRATDCVYATPEALSILNGVKNHMFDAAQKMPLFYDEFDLSASKIHTIDMLINTVTSQKEGKRFSDVSPALGMFRSEPLIHAVNLMLHADQKLQAVFPKSANGPRSIFQRGTSAEEQRLAAEEEAAASGGNDDMPASVDELSATFSRYMGNLHQACKTAVKETDRRSQREQTQTDMHSLGFFNDRIVPSVASSMHLTTSVEADRIALRQARERLEQDSTITGWNLYTEDDVFEACKFVTSTHKKILDAAENGQEWALHRHVIPAVKNLNVWALAAEQYLAQAQTKRVLQNITRCNSHAFVQINKLPNEIKQEQQQQQAHH